MAERERSARVGRTRLPGMAKYIRLRESVFNLWRERKESHGKLTDSEFAEFSCIEVMEGIFLSFVSWHVLSFERASDRLERILLIWRQNLIGHEQSIQTKPKSLKELLVLIVYRFIIT